MKKKGLIFNIIVKEGPITKEKIMHKLSISKVTLGKILKELIKERKIVEDGKYSTGKGRKAHLLKVNPDLYHILSVYYNGHQFIGGLVNMDKKVIYEYSSAEKGPNNSFVTDIISFIKKIQSETKNKNIIGIGISVPGTIDINAGKIIGLRGKKYWEEFPLRDILKKEFKKEVFLIDDTDGLARAEYELRQSEGIRNLLYIYLGEGIGLGMILNGRLYLGCNGNVGEIGHWIVKEKGERCYCGNYGCLETISSVNAIIEDVKKGIGEGVHSVIEKVVAGGIEKIDINTIALSIEKGDKLCRHVIEKAGTYIGKVDAILVNIFNPEIIVLGGPLTKAGDILFYTINNCITRESLPMLVKDLRVEVSKIDESQIITGISCLIIDIIKEGGWENLQ